MFSKNIRTLYLYVVSFLSLMAIIFGTVSVVEKTTNYIYPVDYTYNQPYINDYSTKEYNPKVSEDYTTQGIALQQQNSKVRTLREIFTSLAVIIVAVPLYSYHWTMIQKEGKKEQV